MDNKKFGFKSKSVIDERGFLVIKARIELSNGDVSIKEGRSKQKFVSSNFNTMKEEARLHAVSQALYDKGYFVEASNYEELDIDKVRRVRVLDWNIYYLENQFQSYSNVTRTYKKKGRVRYVVERDSRGRFMKFYKNNSRETTDRFKKELDERYTKREFSEKFK